MHSLGYNKSAIFSSQILLIDEITAERDQGQAGVDREFLKALRKKQTSILVHVCLNDYLKRAILRGGICDSRERVSQRLVCLHSLKDAAT